MKRLGMDGYRSIRVSLPIQLTFLTFYRLQFQVLRLSTMVYQNALSRVEQTQFIQLLATQTLIRTIANILRRPLSSIYRLRAELLETGNLERREGSGRKPILSNRMKTLVSDRCDSIEEPPWMISKKN